MRINVVSICYWPEQTGIGPYAAGMAEHLAAERHEVTAVVGFPHFPAWTRAKDDGVEASETRRGVRILRFPHFIPTRHNAIQRARYELSFFRSVATSPRLPRADLSLTIVPNLAAAYVPLLRSKTSGPYGVVVQDVSSRAAAQSGIPGGTAAKRLASLVEGAALRKAAFVGIVSPAFRPPIMAMGVSPDKIVELPNWTHLPLATRPRDQVRQDLGWGPDVTVALHAGNMGRKQALETVVDGARFADMMGAPVLFVLMGDGNQRVVLEAYAQKVKRLAFLPTQSQDLFPDVLAAADVLLVNERASVMDMSLPSKLTSYFAAGRPIVAAVPSGGSTAAEVKRSGAGVVVPAGDAGALFSAVCDIRNDRPLSHGLGSAGRAYSEAELRPDKTLGALGQAVRQMAESLPNPLEQGRFRRRSAVAV